MLRSLTDNRTTVEWQRSSYTDNTNSPNKPSPKPRLRRCQARHGHQSPTIWDYVNTYRALETYQRPKNSTFWLVERLIRELRGFQLTVITARCTSRSGPEIDTQVLGSLIIRHLVFLLNDANFTTRLDYNRTTGASTWHVSEEYTPSSAYRTPYNFYLRTVFTCQNGRSSNLDKTSYVREYGCDRMFGDSDDDISSCLLGNEKCIPFRILRSSLSDYKRAYNPNLYHESIVNGTEH